MNKSTAQTRPAPIEPRLFTGPWSVFLLTLLMIWAGLWISQQPGWQISARRWADFVQCGLSHLPRVTESSGYLWILCPTVVMFAWSVSLLLLFRQPPDWLRLPVGLVFLFLQVSYLAFRLFATLSFDNWLDSIVSVLFFLSEVFTHLRIALGNLSLLRLTNRSQQADESKRLVQTGEYLPTVDVFVPTYSEPVEMLRRTIIGCQAMDYPNKQIYLLDDQRRPAMRRLAEELGCEYLDRPDNNHAKAGNLNHALAFSQGELILCFDADFIPVRDFLHRTVGFFRDPKVAMVQTPQNFFNEDAVTRNLGLERALEDEQRLFFRTLQPGRDSMNAIVCHGSCWVARRCALEEIGGIPTETITEDWATSIKLQAAGYKLYYLNEALSAGMSADKCGEFVQQRSRWAQGTLQALFASTNPLTIPGLTWKQRLMHTSGIVYYLGSVSSLFNLIAPLLFLFFGAHLLRMTVPEIVFYRLPFMVGFYLLYSWLTRGTRSAVWTEVYESFLAPSMGLTVIRSLVKPFGVGFRVTDKVLRRQRLALNRRVAFPFIVLILLHLLGIAYSYLVQRHYEEPEAFLIVMYFALSNIATLWLCLLISVDIAQERPFTPFKHRLPCLVLWDDTGLAGESISLSEGEVVVKLSGSPSKSGLPEKAFLHLPSLGLADVPVLLRYANGGDEVTAEFLDLTLSQRRMLITYLYCRPRAWDRPPRSEPRAMFEYARAGLRMYPLAESP
jgi:cellulose synthase (UDP-forming)